MIDKVAVPFWLCLTAGSMIALGVGHMALWLIIGSTVGIGLGLLLAAKVKRDKQAAFSEASGNVVQMAAAKGPLELDHAA